MSSFALALWCGLFTLILLVWCRWLTRRRSVQMDLDVERADVHAIPFAARGRDRAVRRMGEGQDARR